MIQLLEAIKRAVAADTLESTVGAGSTTTVVQLGAGQAASWKAGRIANLTGSGGTAANDKVVRTVAAVDATLDKLTVSPALSVAPASGDKLRGGCREWLRYTDATDTGVYDFGYEPSPVQTILKTPTDPRAVLMVGGGEDLPGRFEATAADVEMDVYGMHAEWVEGLAAQVRRLLRSKVASLSLAGHDVASLDLAYVRHPVRADRVVGATILLRAVAVPVS